MKTIRDIDITGKTVLLRADYNVPVIEGEITDDYRISQSLPTIEYLLKNDCKIVIISHLGRPEGDAVEEFSLLPVADRLQKLLGKKVALANDFTEVDSDDNQITILENLRFWPGEEENDKDFAKRLAGLGEVFVQDGFGVVHRAHASTESITEFLPSVGGLLIDKEVRAITAAMENPECPFVAIVGGAKISGKLDVLHALIPKVDRLIIGGAMANTFLVNCPEHDVPTIGKSKYEADMQETITELYRAIARKFGVDPEDNPDDYSDTRVNNFIYLPRSDVAVGKEASEHEPARIVPTTGVAEDDMILDFGYESMEEVSRIVEGARTIIWNGPLGMTEFDNFAEGSLQLSKAIIESGAFSIVGGGDTAGFLSQQGLTDKFDWVSTGGGATLDFMAGKDMPGISALPD